MHGCFLFRFAPSPSSPHIRSATGRLCYSYMHLRCMSTTSRRHFVSTILICIYDAWVLPLSFRPLTFVPSHTFGDRSVVLFLYASSMHEHNLSAAFRQHHFNMHLRCMGASSNLVMCFLINYYLYINIRYYNYLKM